MAKDRELNIHVKVPGVEQAKTDLDKLAQSADNLGAVVDQSTKKQSQSIKNTAVETGLLGNAFNLAKSHLGGLVTGMIAFGAIKIGRAVIDFFDDLIKKQEEAINKAESVRNRYKNLFEISGQFTEQGRRQTIQETEKLLQETGTSSAVGLPAIEEYTRQFKDQMKPDEYQSGIRQVLGYTARHGGEAMPDLIQLMRGYEMNTPAQQGEFMRTISAAAKQSGMTDSEMINLLGKSAPSSKAMGMSPNQTLSLLSSLAEGEIGRNKTMMPASTIDAMASPQSDALKKYHITGKTPAEVYMETQQKAMSMSPQDRYAMLQDIYGGSAKGVSKLMLGGVAPIQPTSESLDSAEQQDYLLTAEAKRAKMEAVKIRLKSNPSKQTEQFGLAGELMGEIGSEYNIEHPVIGKLLDYLPVPQVVADSYKTANYMKEHGNPVIINNVNNQNVIYNRGETPAKPRVTPQDIQ